MEKSRGRSGESRSLMLKYFNAFSGLGLNRMKTEKHKRINGGSYSLLP
jgi:hypothetical protein